MPVHPAPPGGTLLDFQGNRRFHIRILTTRMLGSRPQLAIFALLFATAPALAQVAFSSSDLPIVLVDTEGQEIPDEPRIRALMQIIDNGPGVRNHVTDPANDYDGLIDIEIRGNSSQQYPKKQYRLETVNGDGSNRNVSLLGFPEENDWILHAPYADKTLMRNVLTYDLARRLGQYASRVRYCEVVVNGVYAGVYVLMEKIKRDDNRIDINRLKPDEISGDNLTGGYIIKIDQPDPDPGSGWVSTYPLPTPTAPTFSYQYDDPKSDEIVPEQVAYIQGFMADFESAVQSNDNENPETGYPAFIDLDSFVDFFLINELTKNTDGYRLSSYLYKDKDSNDGRLHAGPVWDFNQGFGNNDYYDGFIPTGFQYLFVNEPDPVPMPTWWPVIVETETFQASLRQRWLELRLGPFHLDSLMNRIDANAAVLAESRTRNFERWPILGLYVWPNGYVGQTYNDEIGFMKSWLQQRIAFLDENIAMPSASPPAPLPRDEAYTLSDATPNPAADRTRMSLTVSRIQPVRAELFDVRGRRVSVVFDGLVAAGDREVLTVDTSAIPAGVYVVRVQGLDFSASRRIVVGS